MPLIDTESLDFLVINTETGNAIAAFMLPGDAVAFIKTRRAAIAANRRQPVLEVRNAAGEPISSALLDQVDRANAAPASTGQVYELVPEPGMTQRAREYWGV